MKRIKNIIVSLLLCICFLSSGVQAVAAESNQHATGASKVYFAKNAKRVASFNNMVALAIGEVTKLEVRGAGEKTIKFRSTSPSVATVNENGVIKGKSFGYTTIKATVGGKTISQKVGVAPKVSIEALRYAKRNYGSKYSRGRRMSKGHYDCSSFVWRSYRSAGKRIGGSKNYAATSRDMARWCKRNGCIIMEGTVSVDKLLPGDLIFEYSSSRNKYSSIYHVDFYQGNHRSVTVRRNKHYGSKIRKVLIGRPCMNYTRGVQIVEQEDGDRILKWKRNFGATGYKIYRSTKKTKGYEKVATVKGKLSYEINLKNTKKVYYYKVKPYWKENGKIRYGRYSDPVKLELWKKKPVEPEEPETPEVPETPEEPETPETPEVPETPEEPETPETPEVPEIPEEPEVTLDTNIEI